MRAPIGASTLLIVRFVIFFVLVTVNTALSKENFDLSEFNPIHRYKFELVSIEPNSSNSLFVTKDWAVKSPMGEPRWKLAELGILYGIIERARGNDTYRLGAPGTWSDAIGALPILGTSYDKSHRKPPSQGLVYGEIRKQNPVILIGHSSESGESVRYLLAVGVGNSGNLLIIDPALGAYGEVNTFNWEYKTQSGSATYHVTQIQIIDMNRSDNFMNPRFGYQ